jgi:FkbM family methyltransferase
MKKIVFNYNGLNYAVWDNPHDLSTNGCINEIVHNDEYNLKFFKSNDNNVILDIGANCGIATIILAKQNPNSIVYSFEPDYNVFKFLEQNIILNNLKNVRLFNKAVAKEGIKTIKLYLHPDYSGGNTTCSSNDSSKMFFKKELLCNEVECISFDEIIKQNNIDKIKLLKIDCEGAEYEILYGSTFFKENIVENMVGEFHNLSYNSEVKSNTDDLINYCKPYISGLFKITLLTL